ncbi:MAG: hypothetical protein ACKPGB_16495, partial [Dolichospermum sp.]
MPAPQEFHDSTLYLIRAETAVIYSIFGDLNQTLITFFLCAFLTLRLCAKQKPWFKFMVVEYLISCCV